MRNKMKLLLLSLFAFSNAYASTYLEDNLHKLNWNGVEVIWIQDETLPTYNISVYFGAGAATDRRSHAGETQLMFDQLTSGTNRHHESQILEALEFFGASYGSSVTHEYSTFTVRGLVKDINPTMKLVCSLFDDAIFPKRELKRVKKQIVLSRKNLVSNHGALASLIFREVSLRGSGYDVPVAGKIKTIKRINSKDLSRKLDEFNTKVSKRIYIKGPKQIRQVESIIKNDCKWTKVDRPVKTVQVRKLSPNKNKIVFIPVPNANQAQVRIGRIMLTDEVSKNQERNLLAAKYMGGGFTSKLMRKLRTEKGYTYSVNAYVSEQRDYGRSGINTFTKNKTIVELLADTKGVIEEGTKNVSDLEMTQLVGHAKGNYLFGLESTNQFLANLMFFDHVRRKYEDIYLFEKRVDEIDSTILKATIKELFDWKKQTIVIVGDKSLVPKLRKAGHNVLVRKYKSYL